MGPHQIYTIAVAVLVMDLSGTTDSTDGTLLWNVSQISWQFEDIPYYHAANGDKDGSIVAARLAGATGGVSDSRNFSIRVARQADSAYASDVANLIVSRYNSVEGPLLDMSHVVVISSVHRAALYIAESLHAPVIPAQTIAFADTINGACDAASKKDAIVMVGADDGYDGLWLWLKPGSRDSVPDAHKTVLSKADKLVMLRSIDSDVYLGAFNCSKSGYGGTGMLIIHNSLQIFAKWGHRISNMWVTIQKTLERTNAAANGSSLHQWEWGLPDSTIEAYKNVWLASGKSAGAMTVLEGGTADGYLAVPNLWAAYLQHNGVKQPRGVHIESYWMAQPTLARLDGALPYPAYAFYKPNWHPIYTACENTLGQIIAATSNTDTAQHTRSFINTFGSTTDVTGIKQIYSTYNISNAWAEVNCCDCPPLNCTDIFGDNIPLPHVHAASVLHDGKDLLAPRKWASLNVSQVVQAVSRYLNPTELF